MISIIVIIWLYLVYFSFLNRGMDCISNYVNYIPKATYTDSPLVVVMFKLVRYHYQFDYGRLLYS